MSDDSEDDLPMARARSEFDASDHTLRERITRIEGKLDNGQNEFSGLRQEIRRVEKRIEEVKKYVEEVRVKPMSRGALLTVIFGPIIGFAVLFGTYVWQAARYPDRAEFDSLRREIAIERELQREGMFKLEQEKTQLEAAISQHQRDLNRIEAAVAAKEKKR